MDSASNEYENGELKGKSTDANATAQNADRLMPYLFGTGSGSPRVDVSALPVITAYDTSSVVRRDVTTATPAQIVEANPTIRLAQSTSLTLLSQSGDTPMPLSRKSATSDRVNLSTTPIETVSSPTGSGTQPIKRTDETTARTDTQALAPGVVPVLSPSGSPLANLMTVQPVGDVKPVIASPGGLPLTVPLNNQVIETTSRRGAQTNPAPSFDVPLTAALQPLIKNGETPGHTSYERAKPALDLLNSGTIPVKPVTSESVEIVRTPGTTTTKIVNDTTAPADSLTTTRIPNIIRAEVTPPAQTAVTLPISEIRRNIDSVTNGEKPVITAKAPIDTQIIQTSQTTAAGETTKVRQSTLANPVVIDSTPLPINVSNPIERNIPPSLSRLLNNEVKANETTITPQPGASTRQIELTTPGGKVQINVPAELPITRPAPINDGTGIKPVPAATDTTGARPVLPGVDVNNQRPGMPANDANAIKPTTPLADATGIRSALPTPEAAVPRGTTSGAENTNRLPAAVPPVDSIGAQIARAQEQTKGADQAVAKTNLPIESQVKSDATMRSDASVKADPSRVENKILDSAPILSAGEKRAITDGVIKQTTDAPIAQEKLTVKVEQIKSAEQTSNASLVARAGDNAAKLPDALTRKEEQAAKIAEIIAKLPEITAKQTEGIHKFSDAIVRVAENSGKAAEISNKIAESAAGKIIENASSKFDVNQVVRSADLGLPLNTLGQQIKNDALLAGQKQNEQQQIASANNASLNAANRNIEQNVAHGHKGGEQARLEPTRRPIDNVKVDQIVADFLTNKPGHKEQTPVGKILNALDNSNAQNQQIEPKNLLDAAAVRRILDGQIINLHPNQIASLNPSLNPNLNPTILEGSPIASQLPGDYALPSLGSLNLSQIIGLGEKLQEAVTGAGAETAEPQQKSQIPQHRTKYIVKEGDTLESIAETKLGDLRLVRLLITINRAHIGYAETENGKVAYVVPDQSLWLPTPDEVEVHKKNFFGKKDKHGNYTNGTSSQQNTPIKTPVNFDRTQISGEVSGNFQDFRPSSNPSGERANVGYEMKNGKISKPNSQPNFQPNFRPNSYSNAGPNPVSGNLDKLRYAGNRPSVKIELEPVQQPDSVQISHRQCYQVGADETLLSIAASLPSMGHISMWRLLAKINGYQLDEDSTGKPLTSLTAGQFIVLPTQEELNEFKLMEKLGTASFKAKGFSELNSSQEAHTMAPPPAMKMLEQGMGSKSTVHKLSSYTRLVLTDMAQSEDCFSVKIEARIDGDWMTLANYECNFGRTTRHLYNREGEVRSMDLDLPPFVVKEMAREDFVRNWNSYVNIFMGVQV